jgi:hypothetical protein
MGGVLPGVEATGSASSGHSNGRSRGHAPSLAGAGRVHPAIGLTAAAFRPDFESWLPGPATRRRLTAERLAVEHGTLEVAREVGLTPAAISQARSWLLESWARFQGEGTPACG